MASLGFTIKKSELPEDERTGFEPIPEGTYPSQITGAELKTTAKGGQMIKVEYTILGDKFQGRKIWGGINIKNDSETAERIGRSQLNQLMTSLGLNELEDTDELVGKEVSIKVKIKPAEGQYSASNEVKGWSAGEKKAGSTTVPPKKTESKPPWAKQFFKNAHLYWGAKG